MPAAKKGQKRKRAAKTVTKRSSFKMVEVTIVGGGIGAHHLGEVLAHCVGMAQSGIGGTVKVPGVTGTVKVTRS